MANSYSQQAQLNCPQCKQDFEATVWLILDTAEHPDLWEQAMAGSLNSVVCPHCGHNASEAVDAPLLVFNPNSNLPVMFFLSERAPEDQDRQRGFKLLSLLQKSLGPAWRADWLARGLPVLPHRSLTDEPAAATDTPLPDPAERAAIEALLPALKQLIDASDWQELHQILDNYPELLQDRTDALLAQGAARARANGDQNMTQLFEQRRTLLQLCRQVGLDQAFAEMTGAGGSQRTVSATLLEQRSQADQAEERFTQTNDVEALEQALAICQEMIQDAGFLSTPIVFQMEIRDDICRLSFSRYRAVGEPADLDRAIQGWQAILALLTPTSPGRAGVLDSVGIVLRARFERNGNLADLEQAIKSYQEALDLTSGGERINLLNRLGNCLNIHYEWTSVLADLDQGIEAYRQALELNPTTPSMRATIMSNLGNSLSQHFYRTGNPADLDQAIQAWQQALSLVSPTGTERGFILNGLGVGFESRYTLTGNRADLDKAIEAHREAVRLASPDKPGSSGRLNNLGNDLRKLYASTGDRAHLEEAIQVLEQAVLLEAPTAAGRAMPLDSLGSALRDRYASSGSPDDLEKAVEAHREAVRLTPVGDTEHAGRLNNLGTILTDRYLRAGSAADLQAAIDAWQTAVQETQPNPDKALYLMNLGMGLRLRFSLSGERTDLEQAIEVNRQGLDLTPPGASFRPNFLVEMGNGLTVHYGLSSNQAELEQAIQAYRQAVDLFQPAAPERPRVMANLGNALSDYFICTRNPADLEQAIQALEQAADLLPPTSPVLAGVLNNLGTSLQARFDRSADPKDLEQAVRAFRQGCEQGLHILPAAVLASACNWGDWASERSAWAEAVQAYEFGRQAIEDLLVTQPERAGKEAWLRAAQTLPGHTAYALSRNGDFQGAVVVLEQGRTRLLAEAQEGHRLDLERLPEKGQAGLYQRYHAAAGSIVQLENTAALAERQPADFDLAAALKAARAELDAVIHDIQKLPGYEDFFDVPRWESIQEQLTTPFSAASGAGAGVYVWVVPQGGMALIVHAGGVQAVPLDFSEAELRNFLVQQQDGKITAGYLVAQMGYAALSPALDQLLPWLGKKLIEPVAAVLTGLKLDPGARLNLIPCGLLGLLPLHAAQLSAGGQATHFMDQFTLAYAPSARSLRSSRQELERQSKTAPTLFAIGNPAPLPDGFLPLAFAGLEVEEITRLFDGNAQSFYEGDATLALLEQHLGDARYLHLSCHGQFKPDDPLSSGVVLSNGESLTVRKLLARPQLSQTQVTVLSACQTAIIDFNKLPEEAVGLPAGFLQAGVPGVVGSLWAVNDLSTALLMIKFYEYHLRGDASTGEAAMPPVQALRKAQLWLRDVTCDELATLFDTFRKASSSQRTAATAEEQFKKYVQRDPGEQPFRSPYFWAPFAFYGA